MNNENNIIGQRINTILAEKELKQKDLAAALGVTDNTISYFASGKRIPNTEQIIKIAKFLNVSSDYLLGISNASSLDKYKKAAFDKIGLSNKAFEILEFCKDLGFSEIIDTVNFLLESQHRAMLSETNEDGTNDILTKLYKYLSVNTKLNDKTLSISSEGNIINLGEDNLNYVKTLKPADLISIKRIKQSSIVERVLTDELLEVFKSAKRRYLTEFGENNNADD